METQRTRVWYALSAGLLIIVVIAGWYFMMRGQNARVSATGAATSTASGAEATSSAPGSVGVSTGGITASDSGIAGIPEPDLNRTYTPPADTPISVQENDRKAVANAVAQLKLDPNHIAYWLELASYRKLAGDYAGAADVWLYCTKRWPTDPSGYNNLADLYGNYTHDYPAAITYWNKLIALQPSNIPAYLNLASLYHINLRDPAQAKATLQAGLKANPGNPDLQNALNLLG